MNKPKMESSQAPRPGRKLDVLVAEKVFLVGKKFKGPKFKIYNGELHWPLTFPELESGVGLL